MKAAGSCSNPILAHQGLAVDDQFRAVFKADFENAVAFSIKVNVNVGAI